MKILFGFLLVVCSMVANATDDLSMDVNDEQKSFVVSLAANPTTGYQWTVLQYDKNILTLGSSRYQRTKTNLIGSGGQMLFIFSLNPGKSYPASTQMTFKYARPWDLDTGTLKNVTVNFVP